MNIGIFIVMFFWIITCNSGIYKWTDEKGVIHFSDNYDSSADIEKIEETSSNNSESNKLYQSSLKQNVGKNEYFEEILKKSIEIKKDAESCYYFAINKKEIDVSCKNYRTILDRDLKPLIKQFQEKTREDPQLNITQEELNEFKEIAKEADDNYDKAVKYILNELIDKAYEIKKEASSCRSYALIYDTANTSCHNSQLLLKEFNPLIKNFQEYIDTTSVDNILNEINNVVVEATDYFKQAMVHIASRKRY